MAVLEFDFQKITGYQYILTQVTTAQRLYALLIMAHHHRLVHLDIGLKSFLKEYLHNVIVLILFRLVDRAGKFKGSRQKVIHVGNEVLILAHLPEHTHFYVAQMVLHDVQEYVLALLVPLILVVLLVLPTTVFLILNLVQFESLLDNLDIRICLKELLVTLLLH